MNDNKNRLSEDPLFLKLVASIFQDWTYTKHYDIFLEVEDTKNGALLDPLVDEFVEWLETEQAQEYLASEEAKKYYGALLNKKEVNDEFV